MKQVAECDTRTVEILQKIIRKLALGRHVAFHVEAGTHYVEQDGKVIEVPNGTATFTLHVNGGAQNTGVKHPEPEPAP